MPVAKKLKTVIAYRSAITGRFVKEGVAKRHPSTTIKQRLPQSRAK